MYHDMAIEDIAFGSDWYSFSCSLGVELVLDELVWSTWQLKWDWLMIHLSCRKSVTWQVSDDVIYWPNWLSSSYGTNMNRLLQWRHNGRDGVSNHQPHQCLLNRLLRRSKKTSKFRAIGLCVGNSPVNSPHKCVVRTVEMTVSHQSLGLKAVQSQSSYGIQEAKCSIWQVLNGPTSVLGIG